MRFKNAVGDVTIEKLSPAHTDAHKPDVNKPVVNKPCLSNHLRA